MSKETKARIKAAEAAFFSTRKRLGAAHTANLRAIVQDLTRGADKEVVAGKYGYKISNRHNLLNGIWRQEEFQEWVKAVQDDMNERVQAEYVKDHHKRQILSEVEKKEELTELFFSLKGEGKFKDALGMIQELNRMEGHYAPTRAEIKDTTEQLTDDELNAAFEQAAAAVGIPVQH